MEEPLVIQMLKQKRAEISGVIAAYQARISQARHDLAHVNASIRLFEGGERNRAGYIVSHGFFKKGEIADICVRHLKADGELNTRELTGYKGILGKIWALPSTVVGAVYGGLGFAYGTVGHALGLLDIPPSIRFGHNGIMFLNNPFTMRGTAITLGNTISFGDGSSPLSMGAYGNPNVNLGLHEEGHTYQYQVLGPFYPLAYMLGGGFIGPDSSYRPRGNPFENGAQSYGDMISPGSYWPKP